MNADYRVKRIYTEEETNAIIAVCYDLLYEEEFEKYLGYPDEFDGKENASTLLNDSTYEMTDELRAEIESTFGVKEFDSEQDYDGYQFYDFGDDDFDDEDDEDFAVPTKNLKRESFNLREALNQIDIDTDNKYDLLNLYEACNLKENEKRALANIVYDQNDPSVIYDTLNNRFLGKEIEMPERVKDGVIHEGEDEFEFDDEFNAYYDGYTKEDEDENSAANRLKRNQVNESYDFKGLNAELRKELPADEIDHHNSDLYVKATPKAKEIFKKYGVHNHPLVSTFIDQVTHTRWFDLPFAYCPEDETQPELEEGWTHFTYKSGANPYIAKTDDEAKKVLNKYKGKVKQVKDGEYEIDDTETDKFAVEESVKKSIKEGFYRGAQGVEFIGHGEWSDPELAYNGYTFNYWDIEDALWSMFLDETGYKDSQSDNPEIEEAFDKYVQNNVTDYLDECVASGAFNGLAVEGEIIEFPCGDYYYVRYDNGKLSLDGDYEIEYDFDNSIDINLQALYDKAVETSPWLVSDGEDDVDESLFDNDEDKAYTYKQVYDELKLETKNFTIDGDTIYYGFESEAENAVKILKRHYNSVECTNCKITFKDKKSKKK